MYPYVAAITHHVRLDRQDWLRCIEGPPGPTGGLPINVVNLSSRLMARWDEPEASGTPRDGAAGDMEI